MEVKNFTVSSNINKRADFGAWIEIRLDRLVNNFNQIQAENGTAHVLAVIKANAYGHGLAECARTLTGKAAYLGVSSLEEVLELKENGIDTPVLLFGKLFGNELVTAIKSGVTFSISSLSEAEEIAEHSARLGKITRAHIKVDTGMGRLGIPEKGALPIIEKISELEHLHMEGLFTHFATAGEEDGFMETQFQKFGLLIQKLQAKNIHFAFRHASNSAGSLKLKSPILNLIRPGLILYGIQPFALNGKEGDHFSGLGHKNDLLPFHPVLSLKSRIILLKKIAAGESVGYGRMFQAKEPCTIATLPIGYSHGYPVHLSNKSYVLYRGQRYPIAGRVSMDYLCVNLGNTSANVGDEITLLGEDGNERIHAEDLARWAETISYEIVTRLSGRLPRIFSNKA